MQVKTTKLGVATYLTPDGSIAGENIAPLTKAVQAADPEGQTNLVIDGKRVPFIDSQGLEYLLDLATELAQCGASLRLVNLNPVCRDILMITRLDRVIPVYDDVESVARSFL